MSRKNVFLFAVAVLFCAPAFVCAQEGPGGDDGPELLDGGLMQPEGPAGMGHERAGMKGRDRKADRFGLEPGRGGPGLKGPVLLDEDDTLAVIKKLDADFAKKLDGLKSIAPAKYKMIVQAASRALSIAGHEWGEAAQKDIVRGISLEFDVKELGMRYDRASDADKKVIRQNLGLKIAELFDLKTKGQEIRVKRMETDISRLKKNLEKRKANKAKIVEQRLDQIIGEGYGW